MEPSAAARFVREHPDACLRFRSDAAGRIAFDRRHLVVLATAVTLSGCTSWHEPDELLAPSDAPAAARADAWLPDDELTDDERADAPTSEHEEPSMPTESPIPRASAGASSVSAAHDPDPPDLRRIPRPIPQLSRQEVRALRRHYRLRHGGVVTMGR